MLVSNAGHGVHCGDRAYNQCELGVSALENPTVDPCLWQSHQLSDSVFRGMWERNTDHLIRGASSTSVHWRNTKEEKQKNIKGEQTCLSSLWLVCYMLSVFICNTHITKSNHCFVVPYCETCPQASDSLENDVTASVYQWLYCSTVSFSAACASGSKTRHRFLAKSVLVKISV